jgi:hypothetical protein
LAGSARQDTGGANGPTAAVQPADDIAPIAGVLSSRSPGFVPWLQQGWFLIYNALLLVLMLAAIPLLVWLRHRARKSARTAALEDTLRRARAAWQKAGDRSSFYEAAADFVQAQLALWEGQTDALIDETEVLARRIGDPVVRHDLQSVLARRDELKYGGGGGGALDPEERHRVTALLEKLT